MDTEASVVKTDAEAEAEAVAHIVEEVPVVDAKAPVVEAEIPVIEEIPVVAAPATSVVEAEIPVIEEIPVVAAPTTSVVKAPVAVRTAFTTAAPATPVLPSTAASVAQHQEADRESVVIRASKFKSDPIKLLDKLQKDIADMRNENNKLPEKIRKIFSYEFFTIPVDNISKEVETHITLIKRALKLDDWKQWLDDLESMNDLQLHNVIIANPTVLQTIQLLIDSETMSYAYKTKMELLLISLINNNMIPGHYKPQIEKLLQRLYNVQGGAKIYRKKGRHSSYHKHQTIRHKSYNAYRNKRHNYTIRKNKK
jgi:hypothetical protein